ncbi:unnamed protein product [Blepharisma stoltei]|uniref:Uncharacterized protein n=1 Tax=Blepharisma stoltei TaxID=1481888 RepID=A0AAU9KA05_9CILI|nr:unnamed protein product [Blepharisma stoltei]
MSSNLRPALKLAKAKNEVFKQLKKLQKQKRKQKKQKEIPENVSLEPYEVQQEIKQGTGKILISGTTVHGTGTLFTEEIEQNDEIIVRTANSEERRKVILVLSDKSACLNEPLSQESNIEFFIQKPPIKVDPRKEYEESKPKKKQKTEDSNANYEIRVKRGPWTYKTDNVESNQPLSQEDLLNIRAQRVRDKFCWM